MIDYQSYTSEVLNISNLDISTEKKVLELRRILERLAREITSSETIQFPNFFARIVFIAQKYSLSKKLEWQLQNLRVEANRIRKQKSLKINTHEYNRHKQTIISLIDFLVDGTDNTTKQDVIEVDLDLVKREETLRLHIVNIDRKNSLMKCVIERDPGQTVIVKYNVARHNDDFNSSIELLQSGMQINIIDYKIDENGYLIPQIIVFDPDYLIDSSALSMCFQDFCTSPMHHFRRNFDSVSNSSHILLGNLANFLLDELIYAEDIDDVSFNNTFLESFKLSPFEYTSCQDILHNNDFMSFMSKAKSQFENIKRVINYDLPANEINPKNTILEPAFFSEKYGFQGRLDLLHKGEDKFDVIELKSGKLPWSKNNNDNEIINQSHYVQISIYRMLINSVFGSDLRSVKPAVLYSAGNVPGTNLRFAAYYQKLNKAISNMRNHIIINEHKLMLGNNDDVADIFEELYDTIKISEPRAKFYIEDIENIRKTIENCSSIERQYLYRYIRFISRELYLQKIGDIDYDSPTGTASLWNSSFEERKEALDVISNLDIIDTDSTGSDMKIKFARNKDDNQIVNFREGELCLIYPRETENDSVLNKQILKGAISEISKDHIEVRFRHKQRNESYFESNKTWAIEHDTLDSSITGMYKNIYRFIEAPQQKKDLLLGICEPKHSSNNSDKLSYPDNIINKALHAEDYFLIVGPPGTGKTSIFAKRLIEEYYKREDTNILILAYTNRAVDELCDTVHAAFGCKDDVCDKYIRIGSELSCSEKYRDRLLQNIAEISTNREDLRNSITDTRIFISTIASINGRQELFNLKHFNVAIIDEASQILEPQIIGLLPRFEKFIMIGDHNQLPAIVLQKDIHSEITEPELTSIGINSCADSLFERLIRNAEAKEWHHVHSLLNMQGRMHNDIAAFPSIYFYSNKLEPAKEWQSQPWQSSYSDSKNIYSKAIASQRVTFFSTQRMSQDDNLSHKMNENEADIAVQIIKSLKEVYQYDQREFDTSKIGIITPYRNQIALIKHKLQQDNIDNYEDIMVDTVERFQGSQRDVIIISFCVNRPFQLNFLSNLNDSGTVDRKLNVSLTRARQQMFLIGNPKILRKHPIYATLLDFMKEMIVKL